MSAILLVLIQAALALAVAPGFVGLVRKVKARLARRRGAPVLQPYRDLWRLLRKEPVVAETASPLFLGAPLALFAIIWAAAALVPTVAVSLPTGSAADLITLVALLGAARFVQALAAMDVGTSFGGLGASREMMIGSLAEPAMLMVAFVVSIVAGTTSLPWVAETMYLENVGLRVSLGLGLIAGVIVALAENARIPIDNPATHLELTMVHEAMTLEYSGWRLGLIEAAAALKLVAYMSVLVCVFAPWGIARPGEGMLMIVAAIPVYLAKLAGLAILLALFETSIAKLRLFRVVEFLGGALVLGLLGVMLLFVSRSF